ncbi:hypothetical protein Q5752_006583 [Cryptotrichosporon argae]
MDTPSASLQSLVKSLRATRPRLILSPPTQPRRASVALIIRLKPAPSIVFEGHEPQGYDGPVVPVDDFGLGLTIDDFFRLDWVNHPDTVPEIMFIRRACASSSSSSTAQRWSSHIAFPGGRQEPQDKSPAYTALRETWEEVGVDLADREFVEVGRLDEREITTSLGKRLLMILSPFVFLQTTPFSPKPDINSDEVSSIHWIPLSMLTPPFSPDRWSSIHIDISTRLSPRNKFIRWALRGLVGKMQFGCVLLPDEPDFVADGFDHNVEFDEPPEGGSGTWYNQTEGKRMLRLWGLSLGMTLDLLAHSDVESTLLTASATNSQPPSPQRTSANSLPPRTPVTVKSSFEDAWKEALAAQKEKDEAGGQSLQSTANGGSNGGFDSMRDGVVRLHHGAGMAATAPLGSQVDLKVKKRRRGVGPGVTAVFPRFTYPDVNFWIWVFGRRYRQVVKGWEAAVRRPDRASDRRTNWSGAALSTFYAAVRHALVVAIIVRALATVGGVAGVAWWLYRRVGGGLGGVEL